MWDRYCRGLVAPSQPRIDRIEKILKGTAQYYNSPLWRSYSPRKWTRLELELAAQKLEPIVYKLVRPKLPLFGETKRQKEFRILFYGDTSRYVETRNPELEKIRNYAKALALALERVPDATLGMGALDTIFLMMQDLRMTRKMDELQVFCIAWTEAERLRRQHPMLKYFPEDLFHQPVACIEESIPPLFLEYIRTSQNIRRDEAISPSAIFWYLQDGPSWEIIARSMGLIDYTEREKS